jgi:hypothetical protein
MEQEDAPMDTPHPIVELLINRKEATDLIDSTTDPALKILLEMAQWQVYQVFMRFTSTTDEEYYQQLPDEPFDMLFYLRSMERLFRFRQVIRAVISGNLDAAEMM